jgi:hypothetical protein|tara:strand:+ start:4148 stop:4438 length:291 start_codon:yes stop_codon:yes gene_type:complete
MVNSYVKDDIHNKMDSHHGPQSQDENAVYGLDGILSFTDWETYYSTDLYNMWSKVKDYLSMSGAGAYMIQYADYNDFAMFCYQSSDGTMYSPAVGH